jgi:GNAT superfamily N-acetyltransferase
MNEPFGDDLIERAERCMLGAAINLGRVSLDGKVAEGDGLILISTGMPSELLNAAHVTKVPSDAAAVIDATRRFFASLDVPWRLWARGAIAEAMRPAAAAGGLVPLPPQTIMLLPDFGEHAADAPPGVSVDVVRDPEGLQVFHETFAAAVNLPLRNVSRVFSSGLLDVPEASLLVAAVEGTPAGTALVFALHGVAYLMTLGTLPHSRRRGLGSYLAWRALLERREACDTALALGGRAYAVYEGMGFREAADYAMWAP